MIVPDYTYPATADVVAIVGATIVLVDISRETMLIDYEAIEKVITPRTRAMIPVSLFGNPLDYDRLREITKKTGIYLIEDAACSLGAEFKGEKVGSQADITIFSFHPRKFITTGEGGLITTNNRIWAEWMNSYKHFGAGISETRLTTSFERIGTNYKLSNLLAAVGLGQMEKIDELLARRIELSENYLTLLKDCDGVSLPQITHQGKHSRQSFCIYINNRNKVMQDLREIGIEVQIGSYALHNYSPFSPGASCWLSGEMVNSQYAFDHCLALPLYHELTFADQQCIVQELLMRL